MNAYKPKVLIVDDEKGLRIGAQRLLTGEGYEVTTAENGTDGIKFGTETEFDLAVIDLKMPDVDGLGSSYSKSEKNIQTRFVLLPRHLQVMKPQLKQHD